MLSQTRPYLGRYENNAAQALYINQSHISDGSVSGVIAADADGVEEHTAHLMTSPIVSSLIAVLLFNGFFARDLASNSLRVERIPDVIAYLHAKDFDGLVGLTITLQRQFSKIVGW